MLTRTELTDALASYKEKRDKLLFDDIEFFEHNLKRLATMLDRNAVVQQVLQPIVSTHDSRADVWWGKLTNQWSRHGAGLWEFPENADEELALRYYLIQDLANGKIDSMWFHWHLGSRTVIDAKQTWLSVVIRPFLADLTRRVGVIAQIPSKEVRDLQAVPLSRIPNDKIKIFLSHRSVDKAIVMRYYNTLKAIGLEPWLDDPEMPAGVNPDRSIKQGFRDSCAVVFFITDNFVDEQFIADEINNAKIEQRNKDKQFVIITLLFSPNAKVPDLLENYIYKHVNNDLEGFYEIMRALPIELGRPLWKENVV